MRDIALHLSTMGEGLLENELCGDAAAQQFLLVHLPTLGCSKSTIRLLFQALSLVFLLFFELFRSAQAPDFNVANLEFVSAGTSNIPIAVC